MKIEFALTAVAVLTIIAYSFYINSIFRGKSRPNHSSWMIWTTAGAFMALSSVMHGGLTSIWVPFYFFFPLIVLLVTFKCDPFKWNTLDKCCLLAAGLGLTLWVIVRSPAYSTLINLFIELTAAVPTIIKTYYKPKSEEFLSWFLFLIACVIEFVAVEVWNISALYPVYLCMLAAMMVVLTCPSRVART
jgi:hypothetical protein